MGVLVKWLFCRLRFRDSSLLSSFDSAIFPWEGKEQGDYEWEVIMDHTGNEASHSCYHSVSSNFNMATPQWKVGWKYCQAVSSGRKGSWCGESLASLCHDMQNEKCILSPHHSTLEEVYTTADGLFFLYQRHSCDLPECKNI